MFLRNVSFFNRQSDNLAKIVARSRNLKPTACKKTDSLRGKGPS
jgi:hypothetical protein